jgi:glycosyltransferase involved in cell wall biosynthesis
MKLLIITNNPDRPSFRQRIEIYLQTLRSNGIDCEVAKLPPSEFSRIRLFKQTKNYDGVLLQKKCLNFYDALCLRKYSKKIIYDFDDAIMYSSKRPEAGQTSHFRLFRRTAKLADAIIAGNTSLAEHAQKFNDNVHVLPTGLNTKEYKIESKIKDDGKIRLVWIGSKSTLPYLKQLKPALEEIGIRFDNIVLRIICDRFFELENIEVEKCHWSLEDQANDLATADIGLAPLSDNRFTRGKCGFKALQYAAAALPTIASPVGVNSEYVINGITGYHAQDIRQWIDRITELIENPKLRKQMAEAAEKQVENFDYSAIGEKMCELINAFFKEDRKTSSDIGKPLVSICIPTYNRKEYLKETIASILAQTYQNFEIVIVDDGSTDGTAEAIKNLPIPVKYHWQQNAGDAATRNKLIELAEGEYISFIDSDDLLVPDAIERMVNAAQVENEDVAVYGSYYRIDQAGKVYGKCKRKLRSGNITKYLFQTILVHACGSMFPKKMLMTAPPFNTSLKVCSDYELWLRLSSKYRFIAMQEPTFKRRRHPDNLSFPSYENCLTELKVLENFYFENDGKNIVPKKIAMKVLSKEKRRVGNCASREGLHDHACKLLRESFKQHPTLKTLFFWAKAAIIRKLA